MAVEEITVGTTGIRPGMANADAIRRSTKKFLRIGNKRIRLFHVKPADPEAVSETISVPYGRKAECWHVIGGVVGDEDAVTLPRTTSGNNTLYTLTAAGNWSGKEFIVAVEVPH